MFLTDKSVLSAHINNIKKLSEKFLQILFKHTRSENNNLANRVAIESLRRQEEMYLINDIPSYARKDLEKEWSLELD